MNDVIPLVSLRRARWAGMMSRWCALTVGTTSGTSGAIRWFLAFEKTGMSADKKSLSERHTVQFSVRKAGSCCFRCTASRHAGITSVPGSLHGTLPRFPTPCCASHPSLRRRTDSAGDARVEPAKDELAILEPRRVTRHHDHVADAGGQLARERPVHSGAVGATGGPLTMTRAVKLARHAARVTASEQGERVDRGCMMSAWLKGSVPCAKSGNDKVGVVLQKLHKALPHRPRAPKHANGHLAVTHLAQQQQRRARN